MKQILRHVTAGLLTFTMILPLTGGGAQTAVAAGSDPVYINENAAELTGEVRFYTAFAEEVGTGALIEAFNEYYPNVTVIPTE